MARSRTISMYERKSAACAIHANAMMRNIFAAGFPFIVHILTLKFKFNWGGTAVGVIIGVFTPMPFIVYFFGARFRSRSSYRVYDDNGDLTLLRGRERVRLPATKWLANKLRREPSPHHPLNPKSRAAIALRSSRPDLPCCPAGPVCPYSPENCSRPHVLREARSFNSTHANTPTRGPNTAHRAADTPTRGPTVPARTYMPPHVATEE